MRSLSEEKVQLIVVPETHWDRAWYLPFEVFRRKLVQLFDRLLPLLESDPGYTCFVADGQTVVIEDYLQIRPQERARLEALVRARRLRIGPWYVLPDEFLVSGESLVRNLMHGRRIARETGHIMEVGYVPDPFGHVAQMPQILRGFGLDNFLFTRGVHQKPSDPIEFIWRAPDGSEVLALNQHPNYGNASMLGYPTIGADFDRQRFSMSEALDEIEKVSVDMAPRVRSGIFLINNGIDHVEAQPNLVSIIKAAKKRWPHLKISIGGYDDYVKAARKAMAGKRMAVIDHELSFPHSRLLKNVYSARVYLKQANVLCESLLTQCAEPLEALARRVQPGRLDERQLLRYAWLELMKNHPHDDICGCSVDRTHEDMVNRFARVEDLVRVMSYDALRDISNHMDHTGQDGAPFVLYNPSTRPRRGVQRVRLLFEMHEVDHIVGRMRLVDGAGRQMPFEVVHAEPLYWWECRKDFRMWGLDMLIDAGELPPMGFKSFYAQALKDQKQVKAPAAAVRATAREIENEFLKVRVAANGTYSLTDKRAKITYEGLGLIENQEDCGDAYSWSDFAVSKPLTNAREKAKVTLTESKRLSATLRIELRMQIPASLAPDRHARSGRKVAFPVTTELTLGAGSDRLEIRTTIENRALDHRTRVLFPTPFRSEMVQAGGQFDTVERAVDPLRHPQYNAEIRDELMPTDHFAGFVRAGDTRRGLALMARGLCEYESVGSGKGTTLAMTLFRANGWLSRSETFRRPRGCGPNIPSPGGQMQGEYTFEYALYPHKGDWTEADLAGRAQEYILPPMIMRADQHGTMPVGGKLDRLIPIPREGELPETFSLVRLEPKELVLTALKPAEEGRDWIVRFYNQTAKTVQGTIELAFPAREVWTADLSEKRIKRIGSGKRVKLRVGGKKIVTLAIRL